VNSLIDERRPLYWALHATYLEYLSENNLDSCLDSVESYLRKLGGFGGISITVSEGFYGGHSTSVSVPSFYGYGC
jgi:hypothetical protein